MRMNVLLWIVLAWVVLVELDVPAIIVWFFIMGSIIGFIRFIFSD